MESSYRNCKNELGDNKRKDAKFCCMSCRKMEQTYRKRKAILLEKYKQNDIEKIKMYKNLQNIIKEEYKN